MKKLYYPKEGLSDLDYMQAMILSDRLLKGTFLPKEFYDELPQKIKKHFEEGTPLRMENHGEEI